MFVVETYDEDTQKKRAYSFPALIEAEEFMVHKWREGYLCRIDCPSVSVIGDGTTADKLQYQFKLLREGE